MFEEFESDMAGGIKKLCNATRKTDESNDIAKQTPGSLILTLQRQVQKSDL